MAGPDAPGKPDDTGGGANAPARDPVPLAVAELRRLIPEGSNRAIVAALTTLAELGDAAALRAVEEHLAGAALSVDYGDRDSDPSPWELGAEAFALLARWWRRLGLADERGAWLAADWLGDRRAFGGNGFTLFTRTAPHLAEHVAPPLIAACAAGQAERRARAASGLKYAPTGAALDTLVALLGDRAEGVANEARSGLSLLAHPARPGSSRHTPSAPDAVATRLARALEAASPAVRRRALAAFAWFAGVQHRGSIALPPHFAAVFPAVARLLADSDPEVRRIAAKRIVAAGHDLDNLRPSREEALELRLPDLDLAALLVDPEPEIAHAALYVAGRPTASGHLAGGSEAARRILAMLDGLRGDPFRYPAALYALGRLGAAEAIPALARHLDGPKELGHIDALLVLARLRHAPAIPHLVRLLGDLTYRQDAHEALAGFATSEALPAVLAQVRASPWAEGGCFRPGPWEVRYLEAHGDAEALALLRQTESYRFAARYCGAEGEGIVAAARRLERRLLLEAGLSAEEADDPVATVARILTGPLHPLEREPRGEKAADHGEQRARWRNLCVAFDGWLLAEPPPPLGAALERAAALLEDFPDVVREAHERWWLDVVRGGQLGLPRVSAVARARIVAPRAPWRLARALVVNEGIAGALDPAATLAWPGLSGITTLTLEYAGWLRALAGAPASLAPRVLRAGIYDDGVAASLLEWPGLARLERLEILWSIGLSDEARASLVARTLAPRFEQAWRTPEGSYLVARAFEPVHDSYGGWIRRAGGSVLAVGATYTEVTAAGAVLRVYGGPFRHYAPEETMISAIFEVVDGALHEYLWHEAERPAPGSLDDRTVRAGLVPARRDELAGA